MADTNRAGISQTPAPISLQASIHDWDPASQSDAVRPYITLTFWLPSSGVSVASYSLQCVTPEHLWQTLREVCNDPLAFYKEHFNFTPYEEEKTSRPSTPKLPTNLEDLF